MDACLRRYDYFHGLVRSTDTALSLAAALGVAAGPGALAPSCIEPGQSRSAPFLGPSAPTALAPAMESVMKYGVSATTHAADPELVARAEALTFRCDSLQAEVKRLTSSEAQWKRETKEAHEAVEAALGSQLRQAEDAAASLQRCVQLFSALCPPSNAPTVMLFVFRSELAQLKSANRLLTQETDQREGEVRLMQARLDAAAVGIEGEGPSASKAVEDVLQAEINKLRGELAASAARVRPCRFVLSSRLNCRVTGPNRRWLNSRRWHQTTSECQQA
ncbi:MAG: hypothetical protein P4L40_08765 [Terracidiphilus sp.]|nr:hypothetical protein [Terracidiphilus sp.]